jgi:hypothetical protein
MEPTAAPETSSENSRRTPCKIPKTENQYLFHGKSLKSRLQSHGKDYCNVAEFIIGEKSARRFLSIAKAFKKRLKRNWQKKSAKHADQPALYLSSSSSVICHTTGPQPLPKRFLHLMRSRASSFK